MASALVYNGITIFNTLMKRFEQEVIYDDSGTDILYYKYTIGVMGFVHFVGIGQNARGDDVPWPATNSPFAWNVEDPPAGTSFADGGASLQERNIRWALGLPRQSFALYLNAVPDPISGQITNGIPIMACGPADSSKNATGIDMNNGPKPKTPVKITHVSGDTILRIEFEIEICKMECNENGDCPNDSGVVSNRWSMTDDVDNNFYTTRTIQGRLRSLSANLNPQSFRAFCVPPLQSGFRRAHMTFLATSDGLNLDYTVTDVEIAFSAPAPATTWKLSHSETCASGIINNSEVYVMLGGPRNVNKKQLISIACSIIESKALHWNRDGKDGSNFIITNFTVTDVYSDSENFIEARASVQHVPLANEQVRNPAWASIQSAGKVLGKPITNNDVPTANDYNSNVSIDPVTLNPESTPGGPISIIGAFSAYLQSSCSTTHDISLGIQPAPESPPSQQTYQPTVLSYVTSDELPTNPYISNAQKSSLYTYYAAQSQYEFNGLNIQLPIAKSNDPAFSTTGSSPGSESGNPQDNSSSSTISSSLICTIGPVQARRAIRVRATRVGDLPSMPSPLASFTDENGITCTLMSSNVLPTAPTLTADQQQQISADIEYIYAMSRAPTENEQLRTGLTPWIQQVSLADTNNYSISALLGGGTG